MSSLMGDLKRKEVMEQHGSPETDIHKISPLLRMTLLTAQEGTKTEVMDFLAGQNAPKTVRTLVDDGSGTSSTPGDTTPGAIKGGITLTFTQVLQTQTLVKPTGTLADQFKDRTRDVTFADAAEAAQQGVSMTEQTLGVTTKTFANTNDLREYMSALMGDLKRKEVMEQHSSPETDSRKISPLLRVALAASSKTDAKDQVMTFLASADAPKTIHMLVDDGSGTSSTPGADTTPGKITGGITVTLTQVLQTQTLRDTNGPLANQFKDRTRDVTFADAAEAARQGISMTEQTLGTVTRTFNTTDDLRDYMSALMGDLKRKEVMEQHSSPETDVSKISPLLRVTLAASSKTEAKDQVTSFLASADAPKTVRTLVEDASGTSTTPGDTGTTPGKITGGITVAFTQVLQTQTLLKATGTLAEQFKDRTSDVTFADAAEAAQQGVGMTEQTIGTVVRTFATTDDLRDYMSVLMGDLKRKEVMEQHSSPETDSRKISPLLRVTLSSSAKTEAKNQVMTFLASGAAPKTVGVLVDDGSGTSTTPGTDTGTTPGKITGGITVSFTQVLQDQTLVKPTGTLADQFRDRSSDVTFADAAAAAQQGVSMTEQTLGTITKTFTSTNDLRDYISSLIGNLKRKEVMEQHNSPETDTHKISPLLRITMSPSTKTEAKDQVLSFLAAENSLHAVPLLVDDGAA
jgi:hypothetical protein